MIESYLYGSIPPTCPGRLADISQVLPQNQPRGLYAKSIRGWLQAVSDSFLPIGFPHSVSDDYLAYQTYDSLQAFFSTITSLLANRALLQGLGVGDSNSSATFAMLLTIFKDAMSRIATIVFAHRFGLRIEPDAKRYRFLADVFNDTAFFLELYSPYLGPWGKFLAIGTGEALRALCGVAAGASKAALSVHFARHDNLAELNAKEASQETAVGLVGLLVGSLVVKYVESYRSVVSLMTLLVLGHLWVNYLGVCSVHMTTLNRQRATILFREYLSSGIVLSPKDVAKRENVLFWEPIICNKEGYKVARVEYAEGYIHARSIPHKGSGIFVIGGASCSLFITRRPRDGFTTIRILLRDSAGPEQVIMAWLASMEIAWIIEAGEGYTDNLDGLVKASVDKASQADGRPQLFPRRYGDPELRGKLEKAGWNLGSQAFETGPPVRIRVVPAPRKDE